MNIKSEIKLLFRWIKRFFKWLWHLRVLYLFILFPSVIIGMSIFSSNKIVYESFGTFLQVIGILLAVRGILNIRKFYGKPSPHQTIKNWLAEIPKYKSGVTIEVKAIESGSDYFDGTIYTGISTASDTAEERFNNIDKS